MGTLFNISDYTDVTKPPLKGHSNSAKEEKLLLSFSRRLPASLRSVGGIPTDISFQPFS